MTEGIIQQVMNDMDIIFEKNIRDNFTTEYAIMILDYYINSKTRIEKELIEKIEQEFGHTLDTEISSYDNYVLRFLIGDNK